MRKFAALCLAALLLVSVLAACRKAAEAPAEAAPSPVPVERTESITVPRDVIDLCDLDMHAAARRLNLPDTAENTDGSYTVRLTPGEKAALQASARKNLEDALSALPESGTWPFLLRAELSEDCRTVTLYTRDELYAPLRDRTAAQAVYLPSLLCLALCGEETEAFSQTFTVVDERTKKNLDSFIYPEATETVN